MLLRREGLSSRTSFDSASALQLWQKCQLGRKLDSNKFDQYLQVAKRRRIQWSETNTNTRRGSGRRDRSVSARQNGASQTLRFAAVQLGTCAHAFLSVCVVCRDHAPFSTVRAFGAARLVDAGRILNNLISVVRVEDAPALREMLHNDLLYLQRTGVSNVLLHFRSPKATGAALELLRRSKPDNFRSGYNGNDPQGAEVPREILEPAELDRLRQVTSGRMSNSSGTGSNGAASSSSSSSAAAHPNGHSGSSSSMMHDVPPPSSRGGDYASSSSFSSSQGPGAGAGSFVPDFPAPSGAAVFSRAANKFVMVQNRGARPPGYEPNHHLQRVVFNSPMFKDCDHWFYEGMSAAQREAVTGDAVLSGAVPHAEAVVDLLIRLHALTPSERSAITYLKRLAPTSFFIHLDPSHRAADILNRKAPQGMHLNPWRLKTEGAERRAAQYEPRPRSRSPPPGRRRSRSRTPERERMFRERERERLAPPLPFDDRMPPRPFDDRVFDDRRPHDSMMMGDLRSPGRLSGGRSPPRMGRSPPRGYERGGMPPMPPMPHGMRDDDRDRSSRLGEWERERDRREFLEREAREREVRERERDLRERERERDLRERELELRERERLDRDRLYQSQRPPSPPRDYGRRDDGRYPAAASYGAASAEPYSPAPVARSSSSAASVSAAASPGPKFDIPLDLALVFSRNAQRVQDGILVQSPADTCTDSEKTLQQRLVLTGMPLYAERTSDKNSVKRDLEGVLSWLIEHAHWKPRNVEWMARIRAPVSGGAHPCPPIFIQCSSSHVSILSHNVNFSANEAQRPEIQMRPFLDPPAALPMPNAAPPAAAAAAAGAYYPPSTSSVVNSVDPYSHAPLGSDSGSLSYPPSHPPLPPAAAPASVTPLHPLFASYPEGAVMLHLSADNQLLATSVTVAPRRPFSASEVAHLQVHLAAPPLAPMQARLEAGLVSQSDRESDAVGWVSELLRTHMLSWTELPCFVLRLGHASGFQLLLHFRSQAEKEALERRVASGPAR